MQKEITPIASNRTSALGQSPQLHTSRLAMGIFLGVVFTFVSPGIRSAEAQDNWNGIGDWAGNPSLWSNGIPTGTTNASIQTGTVTVSTPGTQAVAGEVVNDAYVSIVSGGVLTTGEFNNQPGATVSIATGGVLNASGEFLLIASSTLALGNGVTLDPVQLGITGTLGTSSGTSTISISSGGTATISGTLTNGPGSPATLLETGGGILILTGSNTFSGTTIVAAGGLQVGNGGASGSLGTGTVVDNSAVAFDRSGTLTVSSSIGGAGTVFQNGRGTTILTGSNSYTGETVVTAGVLQVGNGSTSGNLGTGSVVNSGGLMFVRSGTIAVANSISGTGWLDQNGPGTLILTGGNTYSGSTIIGAGVLQVGNGINGGSLGTGAVQDNGGLAFDLFGSITASNSISGTGWLGQIGNSLLILTGSNAYSGSTIISAGELQVGNGGISGSLGTGSVVDNGGVVFDRSDTITLSNAISGTGWVSQNGGGTLILTGSNTYSGTTTINSGTVQIDIGGASGSPGSGAIVNEGSLVLDSSGTITLPGMITGTGQLQQIGTGDVILSNSNSYSGGTLVKSGTLEAAASGALGGGATIVDNSSGQNSTLIVDAGASVSNSVSLGNGAMLVNSGTIIGGSGPSASSSVGTVTVQNNPGGSIASNYASASIEFNAGGTVTNGGLIGSYNGYNTSAGVLIAGNPGTIVNSGTILGPGNAVELITGGTVTNNIGGVISAQFNITSGTAISISGSSGVVVNSGSIFAPNCGIDLQDGGSVTNNTGGVISAGESGLGTGIVISGGVGTVTNSGTINVNGIAITLQVGGTLTNNSGGYISSMGNYAVTLGVGSVTNSGTISSGAMGGILIQNEGNVTNSGLISGTSTSHGIDIEGGGWVTNSGTINGTVSLSGTATLEMGGVINGALDLTSANSQVILDGSGTQNWSAAVNGPLSTNGELVKQGSGTWIIDRTIGGSFGNAYTGRTVVNAGTLLLAANNATPNSTQTILGGGTLALENGVINESGTPTLLLSADSIISFSGNNVLEFGKSSSIAWNTGAILSIYGWDSTDYLVFGTDSTGLSSSQLGQIDFYSDSGTAFLGTGEIMSDGEVIPFAVPEPPTWELVGGALLALVSINIRERRI